MDVRTYCEVYIIVFVGADPSVVTPDACRTFWRFGHGIFNKSQFKFIYYIYLLQFSFYRKHLFHSAKLWNCETVKHILNILARASCNKNWIARQKSISPRAKFPKHTPYHRVKERRKRKQKGTWLSRPEIGMKQLAFTMKQLLCSTQG